MGRSTIGRVICRVLVVAPGMGAVLGAAVALVGFKEWYPNDPAMAVVAPLVGALYGVVIGFVAGLILVWPLWACTTWGIAKYVGGCAFVLGALLALLPEVGAASGTVGAVVGSLVGVGVLLARAPEELALRAGESPQDALKPADE
jgi:hypothetical protein